MTVISGRKLSAVSTHSGRLGFLVRMCLESSTWHSTRCVLTWKASVTKSQHLIYQLAASMRRTEGNGSGLWPTASANKITESGEIVNADGTPWDGTSKPHSKTTGRPIQTALTDMVKMWPTPSANNQSGGVTGLNGGSGARAKLHAMVGRDEGLKMSGGQLNPQWVEALMGYPIGWTDISERE